MTPQQLLALDKYITAKIREADELRHEKVLASVFGDASNDKERAFCHLLEALEITNEQWWKVELADAINPERD